MAKINIEKANVLRIIDGYGFVATEDVRTKDGETFKKYYTVWTREKVAIGQTVEIEGELTVKLEEYTGSDNVPKQKLAVHVNNAYIGQLDEGSMPF